MRTVTSILINIFQENVVYSHKIYFIYDFGSVFF